MFKVTVLASTGFDYNQQKKLDSSIRKFESVMNSGDLKSRILHYKCSLGMRFENNLGLTNQQVFEKIYAGEENYMPGSNRTADLYLVLVKKWKMPFASSQSIGFTLPNQKEIHTYTWWFNRAEDHQYAGYIAHEWAHKIGFDHSFDPTPTRNYSVPYAFGGIVEELAKGLK